MRTTVLILSFLASTILASWLPGSDVSVLHETTAERDARMAWFREARFGMFIHWGLYSVSEGVWKNDTGYGEWLMEQAKIPLSQYAGFIPQFNPTSFDAAEWVRIAKDAGMKYLVITSKHHDGFCMFPSKLTDWCISSTPFKRDPLAELAAACRQAGIRFGIYYSIMDWHHPDWEKRRAWNDTATGTPVPERYLAYLEGQLTELVHAYHPGLIWFDGQWEEPWTHQDGVDVYELLRTLDPAIIVNGRVDGRHLDTEDKAITHVRVGDYDTPEQHIPPFGFGADVDWETCMTFNNHWSYNKGDQSWKSTSELLRNLIDVAGKGGNYLLNVGPTPQGVIPAASVTRLAEIGRWMKVNGESIQGSHASPFKRLLWGRCTSKPGRLYLHIFDWPTDGALLVPMTGTVSSAYLLAQPKVPLAIRPGPHGLSVTLPSRSPDPVASVLVLEVPGAIDPLYVSVVNPQAANGTITLVAEDSDITSGLRLQGNPCAVCSWTNQKDEVSWTIKVDKPGIFAVTLLYGLDKDGTGNSCTVSIGDQTLIGSLVTTKGWDDVASQRIGTIAIAAPGLTTLTVKSAKQQHSGLMNLRGVTLTPAIP